MYYTAGRDPMSKIRINELARELEVKPNVILDLLPELGVSDKKTHSSSLDDAVVDEVRRRVAIMHGEGGNGAGAHAYEAEHEAPVEVQSPAAPQETARPSAA